MNIRFSKKYNIYRFPFFERWLHLENNFKKEWLKKENYLLKTAIKKDFIVLDVGCGFGRHIKLLAKNCKKIYGIDNCQREIFKARKNLRKSKNAKICLADAVDLPFKNNLFNLVICMTNTFGVLGKKKKQALREMKRVLKKNGQIILSVYSDKSVRIRRALYRKVGLKPSILNKRIFIEKKYNFYSESFSKKDLTSLAQDCRMKIKINKINNLAFIAILKKS